MPRSQLLSLQWIRILSVAIFFAIMMQPFCSADVQPSRESSVHGAGDPFSREALSLQLISGALFSLRNLPVNSPTFNYAQTNLRLGWMLTTPDPEASPLRGNWEGLVEISNSIVFKGFGHYIGGATGLMRYNFIQQDRALIPYIQAGVGIVYTDAHEDKTQQAIGQAIEFTPQASLGFHYRIANTWALDLEGMFHHISNAGMSRRNASINALGGFLGITWYF